MRRATCSGQLFPHSSLSFSSAITGESTQCKYAAYVDLNPIRAAMASTLE